MQLTIALFCGVLTPAVVATRNSFVLHSVDKVRVCLLPCCVIALCWHMGEPVLKHRGV